MSLPQHRPGRTTSPCRPVPGRLYADADTRSGGRGSPAAGPPLRRTGSWERRRRQLGILGRFGTESTPGRHSVGNTHTVTLLMLR